MSTPEHSGIHRRSLLGTAAAMVGGALTGSALDPAAASAASTGSAPLSLVDGTRPRGSLILHNGTIRTFDAQNRTVSGLAISEGRIVGVDQSLGQLKQLVPGDPIVIDLKGRVVVPGMIEPHVHFVSLAIRPGYHVVIESASSVAEIQEMLRARCAAGVPEGQFITAMGGFHPNLFGGRLPNLAELDAAVPDRGVLLFQAFGGPAVTNSMGRDFFTTRAVPSTVNADGTMTGASATAALYNLRLMQTFEDRKRSTLDAMAYSASVGITSVLDEVGFPVVGPPTPGQLLSNFDHYRMYDSWLALHAEGRSFIRLQANFLHNQADINLPELTERLRNQYQLFGDDLFMTGAIGEWGAPGDGVGSANAVATWRRAQDLVAQARWRNNNRALSLAQLEAQVSYYETLNAQYGISDLRWRIDHVPVVTTQLLDRLQAVGGAVQCGAYSFMAGTGTAAGAPFRTIVDHGIKAGIHLDGVHIAPLNPWFGIYYASTGRNALGNVINVGQQLTRDEAIRLYTRENAWFLNMEDKLGSLEVGKLGDLVVLDKDYRTVTDEELKRIRPVLTTVGGQIVHDSGELLAH